MAIRVPSADVGTDPDLSWTNCHGLNSEITEAGEAVFFDFNDGGRRYLAHDLAVYLWTQVSFGWETRRAWTSLLDGSINPTADYFG